MPSRIIDFDALSDPEGSLLLIDATTAPYVHKYLSLKKFLDSPYQETRATSPRSPASAARLWEARPWLGTSRSRSKNRCWQSCRAMTSLTSSCRDSADGSPSVCMIFSAARHRFRPGLRRLPPRPRALAENLSQRSRKSRPRPAGYPIFRYGSGSSDVLHALLEYRVTPFRLLVGHKGGAQINNAIQSLPAGRPQRLRVVTQGCPIGENVAGVDYHQYLGIRCARPGQCLGSLAADLAQHQSPVAAGHGRPAG